MKTPMKSIAVCLSTFTVSLGLLVGIPVAITSCGDRVHHCSSTSCCDKASGYKDDLSSRHPEWDRDRDMNRPQETDANRQLSTDSKYYNTRVMEYDYDGCSYIVVGEPYSVWGTHKGNCKNPIHNK